MTKRLNLTPEEKAIRIKQQNVRYSMDLQARRVKNGECAKCSTRAKPTYRLENHTCCAACLERMAEYAKYGKEEDLS
jgi:hypothetical protein